MVAHLWDEIASEYVFDEGGMATRDYLVPGKLVFGVSVGDKIVLWMRLRARGTAGHGSQPIPDNADIILLHAIEKAMVLPESSKENPVVAEMKTTLGAGLAANKFTSAIQRNTISLTTLTSGVGSPPRVNVIPSSAEATLDCRLLPGTNAAEFVSEMKARINDPRVTVEIINQAPDPGMSPSNTPVFAATREAILKFHPDATVTPMLVPFGTDSAYLQARGVIAYGLTPMVVDAATATTMHSDSERLPVDEFKTGLRIFYDILRRQ
jgi:acetylornithine deacetylase/succinyl-diaminopimelate desuccinylase-like protein